MHRKRLKLNVLFLEKWKDQHTIVDTEQIKNFKTLNASFYVGICYEFDFPSVKSQRNNLNMKTHQML